MPNCKLGFVGVGKMGGAILEGALNKGVLRPQDIGIYDRAPHTLAEYEERGCRVFEGIETLAAHCDMILLAVKPQNFLEVLPEIKKSIRPESIVISIAAGITAEQIKTAIGFDCKVVLAMPNTPLLLGKGATALARVEPTTTEDFGKVVEIFQSAGVVEEIPPNKLNEIIPVNGSSPAIIYLMAETIVNHAVSLGIDQKAAMNLFAQALIGSAEMLRSSGFTPEKLIEMVCSPGGATLEGMKALHANGFTLALDKAFEAMVKRAEELSDLGNLSSPELEIKTVEFESDIYEEAFKLRDQVLRIPLGQKLDHKDREIDKEAIHFVVLKNSKVVGAGELLPLDAFNAQLKQIAVSPDVQKSGVGRLLIEEMEKYAKDNNFLKININSRITAEGFYTALGYLPRGTVFLESGLDHIAMYKDIGTGEEEL